MPASEDKAREHIDQLLTKAGWSVQDFKDAHLTAARGVALRNFPLDPPHGFADYLRYIDGKAAGIIEAKREGTTLGIFSRALTIRSRQRQLRRAQAPSHERM